MGVTNAAEKAAFSARRRRGVAVFVLLAGRPGVRRLLASQQEPGAGGSVITLITGVSSVWRPDGRVGLVSLSLCLCLFLVILRVRFRLVLPFLFIFA